MAGGVVMALAQRGSMSAFVLVSATLALAGCYDVHTVDPGHPVVPLVANPDGWVPDTNALGLGGVWYSYGDQYPSVPRCTVTGMHPPDEGAHGDDECSFVAWPDPRAAPSTPMPGKGYYPNTDGRFCTYGNAAMVNPCIEDPSPWCVDDKYDYANMWGAGIGFDIDFSKTPPHRDDPYLTGWDALAHGIVGVAFDFEWTDPSYSEEPFLRVEFPMVLLGEDARVPADTVGPDGEIVFEGESLSAPATSESHPSGSPFLDAPAKWGAPDHDLSHLVAGHNEILWSQVPGAPNKDVSEYAYRFHPENLLGVQFHVPSINTSRIPYGFCISNLALIRQ